MACARSRRPSRPRPSTRRGERAATHAAAPEQLRSGRRRQQAEAAFLDGNPAFRETGVLDELRAIRVRAPRRARRRLPRLHRRQPVRGLAARGAPAPAARDRLRQPALGQPDVVGRDRAGGAGARRGAALLQRRPRASTPASSRRTRRARCGSSARPIRSGPSGRFLATFDNHNSVNGIREFARAKGARDRVRARSRRPTCAWPTGCSSATSTTPTADGHNLFAYPAQSNFSGVKHPLEWIAPAQERGWDVIVDSAAFVPTSRLDLSVVEARTSSRSRSTRCSATRPGSARCSPGARRSSGCSAPGSAAAPWSPRTSRASMVVPLSGHALFEDGTVNYLGIPAIEIGLRHIERIGIDTISRAGGGARHVAARGAAAAAPLGRQPGDPRLRADDVGPPRRHDLLQLPAPGRPRRSTSASSTSSRRRTASPSGPAASATPAPARPRSRSRATR